MHDSGSFVEVPPLAGTFLANLGDVAHVWSNGRFCNVKHRVQCTEAVIRVSIATFLLAPKEGDVEAPEELVDLEHPRLYLLFTYEHYRNLRLSKKPRAGEALQLLYTINGDMKAQNEEIQVTGAVTAVTSATKTLSLA